MDREELEITIDGKGQVKVHVKGRKGDACLEVRDLFEDILGPVTSTEKTDEFYEQKNVITMFQRALSRRK